jgi:hypothetical protein
MKETDYRSKNPRGSSPPFQESENWIDDGANGSHWVKMPSTSPERENFLLAEPLLGRSTGVFESVAVARWEDDGGWNSIHPIDH